MKIWAVTLVGMASVFVPSALWGQNQRLTGQLQQLFDCAEQNNASLTRMRAAIATAEAGEETARLAQLPDVEAQLSISYLGDARLWNRTFGESMAAPMPHLAIPSWPRVGMGVWRNYRRQQRLHHLRVMRREAAAKAARER